MFPFNPENKARQGELTVEKNKNKQILGKLNLLIKNSAGNNSDFIQERALRVWEELHVQIEEIKSLNYEKAIDQCIGYRTVEDLLSNVAGAEGIVLELKKRNDEVLGKVVKRTDSRYGIDFLKKDEEFRKVAAEAIKEIIDPINKQRGVVADLQDLLVLDTEFGAEYIKLLNEASNDLSKKEKERDLLVLDKVSEFLSALPLSKRYKEGVDKLRKEIGLTGQEMIEDDVLTWEALPPGETPVALADNRREGNKGEGKGLLVNMERIQFIETLGPEKNLPPQKKDSTRNFHIFLFKNCAIACSKFACHAVYVLPRDNWKEVSKKDKGELRFRGAVQLKDIPGWREKLRKFVTGDLTINIDLESEYVPKGQIEWGSDLEEIKNRVREKIFERFPAIKQAVDSQDLEKVHELLKTLRYVDYCEMNIASVIVKFGNFRDSVIASFPEVPLVESDFYILNKKFRWQETSFEEKVKNIRETIFSNFPEIQEAIEKEDFESAKIGLASLTDVDFVAFGLRVVTQGKAKDAGFNTRRSAIKSAFPEIFSSSDLPARERYAKYRDKEEKHKRWGERLRVVFIGKEPAIKTAISEQRLDQAKFLIIQTIHKSGNLEQFTRDNDLHGIYGVADLRGGSAVYLNLAFSEIEWSGVKIRKGA
jgi:hypothetical protein